MLRSRPANAQFIPSPSVPAKVRKETTVNQVDALNKRIAALEKLLTAQVKSQVKPVPAAATPAPRKARAATPAKVAKSSKETTPVTPLMRQTVTTFLSAFRPNQATPAPAPVAPAPVAPVVEAPTVPVAAPAEYVRTAVKLTNFGHGRRETTIDGTKVGITWTGTTFAYFCGKRRGTAADRGDAIASLNVLLSQNGLGAVRA